MSGPRTIVVAGPTTAGKSAFALGLATAIDGELVCADSRQLYAGLAVCSAGPTSQQRALVPHHLFESIAPTDVMTAQRYIERADDVVNEIHARGRFAIIVGGTGMYLRAWRLGLSDALPTDPGMRAALERQFAVHGLAALVDALRTENPAEAARIDLLNPARVMRSLEIVRAGGQPQARDVAALLARPPRVSAHWWLMAPPLATLTARIEARAHAMFAGGLLTEALALRANLPEHHALLATFGIHEVLALNAGAVTQAQAVAQTVVRTRQYARRQITWWNKELWWLRLPDAGPRLVEEMRATLL